MIFLLSRSFNRKVVASGPDQVANFKLTSSAKLFLRDCSLLHAADVTWVKSKGSFYRRFLEAHSDHFHFIELQTEDNAKVKDDESLRIAVGH